MLAKSSDISSIPAISHNLFKIFAGVTLVSLFIGIATEWYFLAVLPAILLLGFVTIIDFQKVFYLLLVCIPISTHLELPGGLALDFPSEPLMIGLMLVYLLYSLSNPKNWDLDFLKHPISLLFLLHLFWTFTTTVTSSTPVVSIKFLLAKTWYVVVFYFLAHRFLKSEKDIRCFFWLIFSALSIVVFSIVVRHAVYGFSFSDVYRVLKPFFSNHVIYASSMVLFFPFVWFARKWYPKGSFKWFLIIGGILLLFVAIQLSYRRAAILTLYMSIGAFYVIRFKWTRIILILGSIGVIALTTHLVSNNTYLDYAPNFEKTITHKSFDSLVEATAKGEDISTMERVYRWVAAGFMIKEKPIIGFGPGNFYFHYKPYAVTSFQTYVSDNPEQSGIHNYYLMIFVEQGIIGFLIFMIFTFFVLIKGEAIYHQCFNKDRKLVIMMALLSIIIIDILLLINDMIETDKIGAIYFMNMAILVNMDIQNRKEKELKTVP